MRPLWLLGGGFVVWAARRKRQRAAALQMDRGDYLGKAEIGGVLEVLQRPASEGEPYDCWAGDAWCGLHGESGSELPHSTWVKKAG